MKMTRLRTEKVDAIAKSLPPTEINGDDSGQLLVLGWGGTYGAITSAVNRLHSEGFSVSSVVLRHLNPMPLDLGDILNRFEKILIPELNLGQLQAYSYKPSSSVTIKLSQSSRPAIHGC